MPKTGRSAKLLVDANLLVLLAVGRVNRNRIETFKRTSSYSRTDFDLLVRFLDGFVQNIYTVPHVWAEVSNLTDLPGPERREVRRVVRETISMFKEIEMPSSIAASDSLFEHLGLSDAAISAAAQANNCGVLTDDLDLYLRLSQKGVNAINFAHLRAQNWGL